MKRWHYEPWVTTLHTHTHTLEPFPQCVHPDVDEREKLLISFWWLQSIWVLRVWLTRKMSLLFISNTQILIDPRSPSLLQFNFVGKLLGPRGNSLKRLQEDTLTKMSILGKGSMRDKEKVTLHSVISIFIPALLAPVTAFTSTSLFFFISVCCSRSVTWFEVKVGWTCL